MRLACCTCLMKPQRAIGVRQRVLGMALAQVQFRLPHLVERCLQRRARLRIEQRRGFGVVVGVAVLLEHRAFLAERRRAGRLRGRVVVLVAAAPSRRARASCVARLASLVGGGLRIAFGFLAEELAVAQAQDALVDADLVAALEEALGVELALLASAALRRR